MGNTARAIGIVVALLAVLGLALFRPAPIQAALNMFLKIYGVDGESSGEGHEKSIDVLEFSWGQSMPEDESKSAGATGVERAIPGQLTITKRVDKASPKLAEFMAKGRIISFMVLDVPRRDGKPGRVITTVRNAKVMSAVAAADRSSEKVRFVYQSYRVDFTSTSK